MIDNNIKNEEMIGGHCDAMNSTSTKDYTSSESGTKESVQVVEDGIAKECMEDINIKDRGKLNGETEMQELYALKDQISLLMAMSTGTLRLNKYVRLYKSTITRNGKIIRRLFVYTDVLFEGDTRTLIESRDKDVIIETAMDAMEKAFDRAIVSYRREAKDGLLINGVESRVW